jgi:FlaA1/EpsC-like NDP-sugar epimerase
MRFKLTTRTVVLVLWDIIATYLAYILATLGTGQPFATIYNIPQYIDTEGFFIFGSLLVSTDVFFYFGLLALVNIAVFAVFRLYNDLWEYASIPELLKFAASTAISTFVGGILLFILINDRFPIRVFLVAWIALFVLVGGSRFMYRLKKYGNDIFRRNSYGERKRTLIVGAGETGSLTIRRMDGGDYSMQGVPIVAIDDDLKKIGMRIHGVKVAGNRDAIIPLVKKYGIEQIVVAIPSASHEQIKAIYAICMQTECQLLTLPNVRDIPIDQLDNVKLRNVDLTDLLTRDEIVLDTRSVSRYIAGETVLITGGGGSIGSELARQVCVVAPKQLVIFDIYENTAYELEHELSSQYGDVEIVVEIGSIQDERRVFEVFEKYRPQVVFHAAAHKHVPLMEQSAVEAVKNNVLGTSIVARGAIEYGVRRFIFISTDKAVNPTSVMGATKRFGEMLVQAFNDGSVEEPIFTAVRFGNVLGSAGSVVPIFNKQIEEGGPLTVTDPEITRYFMTIPEASSLVLQAAGIAKGGEIFVLNMGEPVKIVDLARNLIQLKGLKVGEDIEIEFIGLRPGEKLYEELLADASTTDTTSVKDIFISTEAKEDSALVFSKLEALRNILESDDTTVRKCLAKQVPTYKPSNC